MITNLVPGFKASELKLFAQRIVSSLIPYFLDRFCILSPSFVSIVWISFIEFCSGAISCGFSTAKELLLSALIELSSCEFSVSARFAALGETRRSASAATAAATSADTISSTGFALSGSRGFSIRA
jgi:hypothetical protein